MPLARRIRTALARAEPRIPDITEYNRVLPSNLIVFSCHNVSIGFNKTTGAINFLQDSQSGGKIFANQSKMIGEVTYQSYSQVQYDKFSSDYCLGGINGAFDRGNLDIMPDPPKDEIFRPDLEMAFVHRNLRSQCSFVMQLKSPPITLSKYGAPQWYFLKMDVHRLNSTRFQIDFDLQWFYKVPTRLPESIWFSFNPITGNPRDWKLQKAGTLVSPYDVVLNGSRAAHAVEKVIYGNLPDISIENFHAPLLSPGNASLLVFDNKQPPCENGMHFNLVNNLWNTNYPLWYSQDERFRFLMEFQRSL